MSATKRLSQKIERMRRGVAQRSDFIIADAKDADMAYGITAPGPSSDSSGRWKTLAAYREQIRHVVEQDIVDVMLLSASNLEILAIEEALFKDSAVTPAARANDTTDIWAVRGGAYPKHPSRSFRTASIEHIKYGRLEADCSSPHIGADLGLYSITFTNNIDWDYKSLEDFHNFRHEAEQKGFRYFLEIFNPNTDPGHNFGETASFLNDHIARTLAGVTRAGRPLFLKIPYNGPEALEELVSYDPDLIVGVLGGSAGTTLDAFQLIHDAQKYGARVALFGRKINLSEHPLSFIAYLRRIADGEIEPREATRAYHGELARHGVRPHRSLQDDLHLTPTHLSYR